MTSSLSEHDARGLSDIAESAGFVFDDGQSAAVAALTALIDAVRHEQPARGVYLHGPAGHGKTWLADAAIQLLPESSVVRVHVHSFLVSFGAALFQHTIAGTPAPAEASLDVLLGARRVIVFDEFHADDAADARLLTLALRYIEDRALTLLATSNYAPSELMADNPWRHTMLEGVEILERVVDPLRIDADRDYRADVVVARAGFSSGRWIVERDAPLLPAAGIVHSAGREFPVISASPEGLVATFAQLCEAETAPTDFARWVREYPRWTVLDVPELGRATAGAQQRFITLCDILVDADVPTDVHARVERDRFAATSGSRPDAFRAVSRMKLLRDGVSG